MREDAASEVVGNQMVLLISVAGIALALLVGVPLLSQVQGQAQAKAISEDFIGAAKDLENGEGALSIPIAIPGAFSLPLAFGDQNLGFQEGTTGFISAGSCSLAMDDWDDTSFTFTITGLNCAVDNVDGNCESAGRCLAIDKWEDGRFVPQSYTYNAGVANMGTIDGLYRISVLVEATGNRQAQGYFFEQDAVVFTSGPASAGLENGAFHNGAPVYAPKLTNGGDLVLLSGGSSSNHAGTRQLEIAFAEQLPVLQDTVRYVETSFRGPHQVGYCASVSPAIADCSGDVSRTSHDEGSLSLPFRLNIQTAEARIGF